MAQKNVCYWGSHGKSKIWQQHWLHRPLSSPICIQFLLVLFFPELFFSWTSSAIQECPGCQVRISLGWNLAKYTWVMVWARKSSECSRPGWMEHPGLMEHVPADGKGGMRWPLSSFHPKPVCDSMNKCSSLLSHNNFVPETQKKSVTIFSEGKLGWALYRKVRGFFTEVCETLSSREQ